MKGFFITSKFGRGRGSHDHVVYLDDETGEPTGFASIHKSGKNEHTHDVSWRWIVEPVIDPNTGQEVYPGQGEWVIGPSEDGHTHDEILDYEPKDETLPEDEDEQQIINGVVEHWLEAKQLEDESLEAFSESEDFYCGNQWDEADKNYLTAKNRACITHNVSAVEIDRLCGFQREQREDLHYTPQEDGDQVVADALNIVSKIILRASNFEMEESDVFLDMSIGGRGVFNFYVDTEENIEGEIKIERYPWDAVRLGPHEKKDFSDGEYYVKDRMYSLNKLKQMWPEKADDIDKDWMAFLETPIKTGPDDISDGYNTPDSSETVRLHHQVGGVPFASKTKKEFRLVERWMKIYTKIWVVVDSQEQVHRLEGWRDSDVKAIETLPGFYVFPKWITKIRITKFAGNTLLEDSYPAEVAADKFHIIPVYATKRGNKFWGKMELIKSPQINLNKRMSQLVDILNRMTAYGYYYDDGTFADEKDKKHFLENSTKPGFMQRVADVNNPPKKEEGVKFPSELANMVQMDVQRIIDMMNVQVDSAGANESGSKFLQRQRSRMAGNEQLFDNLRLAKQQIGRMLVHMIQMYYRPERLYRMLESANTREPVELGGQPLSNFPPEEIIRLLTEKDLTKVDIDVTESPHTPTARIAAGMLLQELAQAGAQIPPEAIIQSTMLPERMKRQILDSIAASQEAANAAAKETAEAEVDKTAIAQGIMTPRIKGKLGMPMSPEEQQQIAGPGEQQIPQGQQGQGPMI